jgi:hypothetical protein
MTCIGCGKKIRWYQKRVVSSIGTTHRGCFIGWMAEKILGKRDQSGVVVRSEVPLRGNNLGALIGGTEGVRGVPVRGPRDGEDNGPYDL